MADQAGTSTDRAISFGPFRLLPTQQLLLEGEAPVRLGSRALEILIALLERPGELVAKTELMARIWPSTFVDENTLRVHVAGLRRALGDGQPGRRYVASVTGRGYRFVAAVSESQPEQPSTVRRDSLNPAHNLPLSRSRLLGRTSTIDALRDQLAGQKFVTIVGAGGIGKTAVALALAELLLPAYEDGVRFVDLAPVEDPQFISSAVGTALGLAIHPDNARLVELLRDKRMLIVLDSCEHVIEAAALLAEQLLAGVPGIHILATSREPLRAEGERVQRLQPLDVPADSSNITATRALEYPAVQLFVERAAAILDSYELSDADAPVVSDICRKLGGVALAIELAAARTDAFGIQQLAVLLDDRFRILKQGKRTAQSRHRSLTAALDWSYEFLPETERLTLCRLAVFAGGFTLNSATVVAGDDNADVVEALANLVAKSLVSAEVGGPVVYYRLLDTTRAYALQKLAENGDLGKYLARHAQYHLDWFQRAAADWQTRKNADWLEDYGRKIDDVRAALNWALSPTGDMPIGIALTIASIPLWLELSLLLEAHERLGHALACLPALPTPRETDELILRVAYGGILVHATPILPENPDFWSQTFALAEKLGDSASQVQTLFSWSIYCIYVARCGDGLAVAERTCAIADSCGSDSLQIMSQGILAIILYQMGDYARATDISNRILVRDIAPIQRTLFAHQLSVRLKYSEFLWVRGFPDQAVGTAMLALDAATGAENLFMLSSALGDSLCPVMIAVGDLDQAETWLEMLLDCSAKSGLGKLNALGRCWKGISRLARGDLTGLPILQSALSELRNARFFLHHAVCLGTLAQALGATGGAAEGTRVIDEAIDLAQRSEGLWCMPELLRIKGELLLLRETADSDETAEGHFQQALDLARKQGALSWELRTAMSMAKLWRDQNRMTRARELLSGVYGRFTEGFETADLKAARALIDVLG